jgi:hypothetical protein
VPTTPAKVAEAKPARERSSERPIKSGGSGNSTDERVVASVVTNVAANAADDVDHIVVCGTNEVVIPIVVEASAAATKRRQTFEKRQPVESRQSSETRPGNESQPKERRLKEEDRPKFKSLGDLHIEKGLPVVPV